MPSSVIQTQLRFPTRDAVAMGGRARSSAPPERDASSLLPWLDRKGRLSPLRASVFVLLWVPGIVYASRYAFGDLGARPVHAVLLAAEEWTIWWLLASLIVTPAKAVLGLPGIVVVRRMIGLAALGYGILHLVLYAADEKGRVALAMADASRPHCTLPAEGLALGTLPPVKFITKSKGGINIERANRGNDGLLLMSALQALQPRL